MALVLDTLKSSLTSWLSNLSYMTTYESMQVFCNAYETYALQATDISGDTPLVTYKSNMLPPKVDVYSVADESSMLSLSCVAGSIASRMDNYKSYVLVSLPASIITNWSEITNPVLNALSGAETEYTAAQKFENAIIAFWKDATFNLTIPPAGTILPEISAIVTTNIVKGTLATTLQSIFESKGGTPASQAELIANALHTATLTVSVTCIGTVAVPPPPVLAVIGTIV